MRLRNIALPPATAALTSTSAVSAHNIVQSLGLSDGTLATAPDATQDDDQPGPHVALTGLARRYASTPLAQPDTALVRRQSNSKLAAQLRQLLASMRSSRPSHAAAQSIVMTTVGARDCASLVASSLAVTCAASGFKVLLVDANLARPSLHSLFGISNRAGLSDLLAGSNPPTALAQPTSIPNLVVIPAGTPIANYASLLTRQQIVHRLDAIAGGFDYIIIDATALPPVLVVRVAQNADQVTIAVRRHTSSMRELERQVAMLRDEGIDNASVLIIE